MPVSSNASFTPATIPPVPVVNPTPVVRSVESPAAERVAAPVPQPAPAPVPQAPALPPRHRDLSHVWDVPFDRLTLAESIEGIAELVRRGKPSYVVTANLNYVMLHHRQRGMPQVTEDADMILADGQPIVWRSLIGKKRLPERVAGSEMIYDLAERARDRGWGIYFLGGEPGVAQKCADELTRIYPNLNVAGVESPPFRVLNADEQAEQDQRIKASGAKILLVAFGQPKGERWIHENYQRLGIPVSIQLGASFDFIAGTAKRAPEIWQKMGMEWFYRMASDPKRLVPRYASNISFLIGAIMEDWKRKVTSWGMGQWTEPPATSELRGQRRSDAPAR